MCRDRGVVAVAVQTKNRFVNLCSGKYLSFVCGKIFADEVFAFCQGNGRAIHAQFLGRQIDFYPVKGKGGMTFSAFAARNGR